MNDPGSFRRACPDCKAQVDCRHVSSAAGLGVTPYELYVQRGPDHNSDCQYWRSEIPKRTGATPHVPE
jgi:hypothetical protein